MTTTTTNPTEVPMPQFRVLGVPVNAVQIPEVVAWMESSIEDRSRARYVAVTGMHGVTESRDNPEFRTMLKEADLVVPDGMPLVWLGRMKGFPHLARRVYGPELMETFCRETGPKYRHFFYGGAPGVADHLAQVENQRYGVVIAGTYCPPFRPLTLEEDREVMSIIAASHADVVWVGLSTPKQERWMYEHRDKIQVPLMLGVGAAFDLNTGRLKQAPRWMREHGLEWLFRLLAEPQRLWKRYLVQGSRFVWNVLLELTALRVYE
jgi:N-acetylglucosaminyldiphosphoundecaprenol N-acetyl-beta-D-mannosaminyltransferase